MKTRIFFDKRAGSCLDGAGRWVVETTVECYHPVYAYIYPTERLMADLKKAQRENESVLRGNWIDLQNPGRRITIAERLKIIGRRR